MRLFFLAAAIAVVSIVAGCVKGDTGPMGPAGTPGDAGAPGTVLGPGYVNVRNPPYSAAGDGTTDDGSAIQRALNDVGAAGGGRVFLPTGNYLVSTHLSIPNNTALSGVFTGPPKSLRDVYPAPNPTPPALAGTTLLAVEGSGSTTGTAFITLAGYNATVEGLAIYYPNQIIANPPKAYPWTIALGPWPSTPPQTFGAENATIQNIVLVNSYNGIDLASQPSSRHLVRGVYGQPLHTGIVVDKCYDVGRIQDVHFNAMWSGDSRITGYTQANGTVLVLYRTDGELIRDLFAFGYHTGIVLAASPNVNPSDPGCFNIDCSPDGEAANVEFDTVTVGIELFDTKVAGMLFSNFIHTTQAVGSAPRMGLHSNAGTRGYVTLHGANFSGNISQAILLEGIGSVMVTQGRFLDWGAPTNSSVDPTIPAVEIRSGRALIQNSEFFPQFLVSGPTPFSALKVTGTDRVMFTSNMMNTNTTTPASTSSTVFLNGNF